MPSDYKNSSLKMMYPWQGSNQQLVQSPIMINQTASTIGPTTSSSDEHGDTQFNHIHHLNNHSYNNLHQGQNQDNYLYNNHNHLSSATTSSHHYHHHLQQNIRVSPDSGNLINSNDYNNEDKDAIIDQLIFNLNGKLTLNNNPDSYQCHSLCKERRLSPYSTTGHTSECTNYHLLNSTESALNNADDPAYRLMQQLIKEGALIKEAVRRLQYTKSDSPIAL